MAKKSNIRIASTDEKTVKLVDRGCEIDSKIKELSIEDKGVKKILAEESAKLFQESEKSLKLAGNTALATVSLVEKYELDASKEIFPLAEAAIKSGVFSDAVRAVKTLYIPPEKIDEACELLKKAGINALLQVNYDINPEEFRILTDSKQSTPELQHAVDALKVCAVKKMTTRISYEKKS